MALADILSELEACGYRTRTFLIPACAVGARHRRYRVAIVGYSEHNGLSSAAVAGGVETTGGGEQERKETAGESPGTGGSGYSKVMADTNTERELQSTRNKQDIRNGIGVSSEDVQHADSAGRKKQYTAAQPNKTRLTGWRYSERKNESGEWATESIMDRMANGLSPWMDGDLDFIINHYWDEEPDIPRIATRIEHRVDRLKCLGNAVVPQQFYPIFEAIAKIEMGGDSN